MILSKKQKTFSEIIFAFLKSTLNFEHLPKKNDPYSLCIFGIPVPKNMVRWMAKKPSLSGPLDRQRGKCIETLLESQWQHLYNIYQSLGR